MQINNLRICPYVCNKVITLFQPIKNAVTSIGLEIFRNYLSSLTALRGFEEKKETQNSSFTLTERTICIHNSKISDVHVFIEIIKKALPRESYTIHNAGSGRNLYIYRDNKDQTDHIFNNTQEPLSKKDEATLKGFVREYKFFKIEIR